MESLSMVVSSCPLKTQKPCSSKPISTCHLDSHKPHFPTNKTPLQSHPLLLQTSHLAPLFQNLTKTQLSLTLINLLTPLPCFASEPVVSDKINLEFISAIDAFRKLRDEPNVQLLDIRDNKTVKYLRSPNLKILNKGVVQVQYSEGDEDGFVKKVLQSFGDVSSTVVCVLDNFDGNSMKVAELLFKNGFKEAYAIRGGVRGDKGWLAIQDSLLPPSVHIYPKKKVKTSQQLRMNGVIQQTKDENGSASSANIPIEEKWINDGHLNKTTESQ
ncbi:hypothetical protein CMV_013697 [Castanea mollissima]|uniref:Rhodanese domain-containing protein n=1 Tax=Castanea mollissima TaxID=60419 RepID=A0A8J4RCY7_9ROSI|nr:hypothetical protein CMV_013697 [Castanea mollissima]